MDSHPRVDATLASVPRTKPHAGRVPVAGAGRLRTRVRSVMHVRHDRRDSRDRCSKASSRRTACQTPRSVVAGQPLSCLCQVYGNECPRWDAGEGKQAASIAASRWARLRDSRLHLPSPHILDPRMRVGDLPGKRGPPVLITLTFPRNGDHPYSAKRGPPVLREAGTTRTRNGPPVL